LDLKIVHTYDEWRTSRGMRVQIGTGLLQRHFEQAMTFLADTDLQHAPPPAKSRRQLPISLSISLNVPEDYQTEKQLKVMSPLNGLCSQTFCGAAMASTVLIAGAHWAEFFKNSWPWLSIYLPYAV